MYIKKLSDIAIIPSKGSKSAAGYDLYTTESYELKVGERKAFKTDISLAIPNGLYGRIAPRSGLAVKKGIDVLAGVIDSDYRGEILVALINLGQEAVQINAGDKIAQIIFEIHRSFDFSITDDLDVTDRGVGGFGSTDAIPFKTQSAAERNVDGVNIPEPVKSLLLDRYNGHQVDLANKVKYSEKIKYSDVMKEKESLI